MKLYITLTTFIAMVVFAEAMLHNCKMLKCPTSKTVASSTAYTVSTTKTYYEPKKPITVIVSSRQCPRKKKQPGPEWYKIEVINATGFPVTGKFVKPSQRSEDRACEKNSLIIFHTCEPLIMHDLPRKYVYRMQKDIGDICFRITFHNKGNSYCEVIKHCIKSETTMLMDNTSNTTMPDNSTSSDNTTNITTTDNSTSFDNMTIHNNQTYFENTTVYGNKTKDDESSGMSPVTIYPIPTTDDEPTKKPTEKRSTEIINILIGSRRRRASRCRKCRKVTNAAEKVCGTNNKTYDSNCHLQREACVTGKNIRFDYGGQCRENPPTYCDVGWGRLPDSDWYSGCNCFGYYKPRQCYRNSYTGQYDCWCSDELGFPMPGTVKKYFDCSEKSTESRVMDCF